MSELVNDPMLPAEMATRVKSLFDNRASLCFRAD